MSKKEISYIFDMGSSLIVLGYRSFLEIRVAAVKRDILLWAAVAALEGGVVQNCATGA